MQIFVRFRLAVADLLMSSVGVLTPFIASYKQEWPFGEIGCAYDGFIHYVVGNLCSNRFRAFWRNESVACTSVHPQGLQ